MQKKPRDKRKGNRVGGESVAGWGKEKDSGCIEDNGEIKETKEETDTVNGGLIFLRYGGMKFPTCADIKNPVTALY